MYKFFEKRVMKHFILINSFILPSSISTGSTEQQDSPHLEVETEALISCETHLKSQMAHSSMSGLHPKSLKSNKPELLIYPVKLTRKWTEYEFYPIEIP